MTKLAATSAPRAPCLWAGIRALATLAKESDQAKSERYERQFKAVAQRAWNRVWPDARDQILARSAGAESVEQVEAALASVDEQMRDYLTDDDADNVSTTLVASYEHGHVMAMRDVRRSVVSRIGETGNPAGKLEDKLGPEVFTVRDERAIEWLERDTMYWIGNAWDEGLGADISAAALKAFTDAKQPADVAKDMADAFQVYDRPDYYWDVVANAATVRSRTMGQVSGLNRARAKSYRFQALVDQRTTQVCRDMNGKIFTIEQANAHADRVIETDSPDAMKEAWPWVKPEAIEGQSTDDLAAAGVMMPPLHGNCRSVIVVQEFA